MNIENIAIEQTFVMVKPEGVQRRLIGQIVSRFEARGLQLQALKFIRPTLDQLKEHYIEHKDRDYFQSMIGYLSGAGPVLAMVWSGPGSVDLARQIIGLTDPSQSRCCTLRGDYALSVKRTAVHGADSPKSAQREISIWFEKHEIMEKKSL
jgi:nucleoside-diphosphate kinase